MVCREKVDGRYFRWHISIRCHVNIITGSGVMTIFFYKRLTRNPKIGNSHVWVLPNIWRLGRVSDTKHGANVSNKMLLKALKMPGLQLLPFMSYWGKSNRGAVKLPSPAPPPPFWTQIRVKGYENHCYIVIFAHFTKIGNYKNFV